MVRPASSEAWASGWGLAMGWAATGMLPVTINGRSRRARSRMGSGRRPSNFILCPRSRRPGRRKGPPHARRAGSDDISMGGKDLGGLLGEMVEGELAVLQLHLD